jgi:hypothetical protein
MTRFGYANSTDRVAAACIAAARPWRAKYESDLEKLRRLGKMTTRPLLGHLVVWLAKQAAQQGLLPADLDSADGAAALAAIADAIFSGKQKTAFYETLPVEWKHVASAAQRIIDRETPAR